MSVVRTSQAIVTYSTVEVALVVIANKLEGFAVFEAVGVVGVHLVIK